METIIDSLERSLQNCSLDQTNKITQWEGGESSSSSDEADQHNQRSRFDTKLELNSHVSLPYNWEQRLDLKTGEIYYINWKTGMKAKQHPAQHYYNNIDSYSDNVDDDDRSSYDSDNDDNDQQSSSEFSISSSRDHHHYNDVLVVAGCKKCLMYFMVPKFVQDCPKCFSNLLHFDHDRSANGLI